MAINKGTKPVSFKGLDFILTIIIKLMLNFSNR